jgi:hypothetical protein
VTQHWRASGFVRFGGEAVFGCPAKAFSAPAVKVSSLHIKVSCQQSSFEVPAQFFFSSSLIRCQAKYIKNILDFKIRAPTTKLIMDSRPRHIPPSEWNHWKDTILALRRGKTLKEVMALMRDVHGFSARYSISAPYPTIFS